MQNYSVQYKTIQNKFFHIICVLYTNFYTLIRWIPLAICRCESAYATRLWLAFLRLTFMLALCIRGTIVWSSRNETLQQDYFSEWNNITHFARWQRVGLLGVWTGVGPTASQPSACARSKKKSGTWATHASEYVKPPTSNRNCEGSDNERVEAKIGKCGRDELWRAYVQCVRTPVSKCVCVYV